MAEPLRCLLVGCGHIVHAHMDGFRRFPERAKITAICDPNETMRDRTRRDINSPDLKSYESLESALEAEQDQVDMALITTPHWLHAPQSALCLEAGLPTLVEKPACNTLEDAMRLIEVQERTGVPLMVGQTRRFMDQHIWARQWVKSNPENFGRLRSFNLQTSQSVPDMFPALSADGLTPWILDKERAGGGLVLGVSSHLIDLIRFLFDEEFTEVSAWGKSESPMANGAESLACAMLKTTSGAIGTLHADYMAKKLSYCEAYEFIGSEGNLTQQTKAPGDYSGPTYFASAGEGGMLSGFEAAALPPEHSPLSHFGNQLVAFTDAVQSGSTPPCSIQDNYNTLAVVDAIYRSLESGGETMTVNRLSAVVE